MLAEQQLISDSKDPVRRLIDNGILFRREYAGVTFIRFAMDPLSEYLAAMYWARLCGPDEKAWKDLDARVNAMGEKASGFRDALELVHFTYGAKFGWWS